MAEGMTITTSTTLGPDGNSHEDYPAVARLVEAACALDGFSALNEAGLLHLRHPREGVLHLLAWDAGELVGYAQLDDHSPPATGQLVVDPSRRGSEVGSALLTRLLAASSSALRIWAMGDTPAARALARRHGLVAARELLIMTRRLSDILDPPPVPAGTTIRSFVTGQDEDAWLAVNARAFAQHPEQSQITRTDLEDRMAEPWFDSDGFLVAVRADAMVGFHWTKQHPQRLGEVYVLGVDPSAAGEGLGHVLLGHGLHYLQSRGNTVVELYVEATHTGAIALYAGYGFTVTSRDVMYAQP